MKKRMAIMLMSLMLCVMLPTVAFAEVQTETGDSNEKNIEIEYEDMTDVFCWIDDIRYHLYKEYHTAAVLQGRKEGDSLEIPSNVEFNGEEYTITQYLPVIPDFVKEIFPTTYKHICFPDTIKILKLSQKEFPNLESLNIPQNTDTVDIEVDFRKVRVELAEGHNFFFEKNHALYSKENPNVLEHPLDISDTYTVENGVTEVYGFNGHQYVRKVVLPDTAKKCSGFARCLELQEVDLSKTKIEVLPRFYAFGKSPKLKVVKLPPNITTIPSRAFFECKSLKMIVIPSRVKKIKSFAFEECENLGSVKLSDDLTNIEARAFHKTALKEITLPSKVTKVEYAAFKSCPNLSKVTLKSTKKAPVFEKKVFGNTKSGLPFYVKNKTVAKSLKQALKGTGVKKAKIYVGKKLVYKNVQ